MLTIRKPKSQVVIAQALAIIGACVEPVSHSRAIFVGLAQAAVHRLQTVQGKEKVCHSPLRRAAHELMKLKAAELHDITIASLDCLTEYFGVMGKQDKPEAPAIVSDCWDIAWPAVVGVMHTCSTEDILKVRGPDVFGQGVR